VAPREEPTDLGFGTRTATDGRTRFLNRDGSFNVIREGLPLGRQWTFYHALVQASWPVFLFWAMTFYLGTNLLFALGYFFCGEGGIEGGKATDSLGRLGEAFSFSVQTLATIGYGRLVPASAAAHALVTVEVLIGGIGFALITGLSFARFSRPMALIHFSRRAVVAPYRGGTAFEFRIANERKSQLVEVQATVSLSRLETENGRRVRRFHPLPLERERVAFFPLQWVVVHPIDGTSPLVGATAESLAAEEAEFLILLTGVDETFAQTLHVRSSYKPEEIVVGARFADMFLPPRDGKIRVDMSRLDDIESAPLPVPTPAAP
jgi:inward rectifier potassium channel